LVLTKSGIFDPKRTIRSCITLYYHLCARQKDVRRIYCTTGNNYVI